MKQLYKDEPAISQLNNILHLWSFINILYLWSFINILHH